MDREDRVLAAYKRSRNTWFFLVGLLLVAMVAIMLGDDKGQVIVALLFGIMMMLDCIHDTLVSIMRQDEERRED